MLRKIGNEEQKISAINRSKNFMLTDLGQVKKEFRKGLSTTGAIVGLSIAFMKV